MGDIVACGSFFPTQEFLGQGLPHSANHSSLCMPTLPSPNATPTYSEGPTSSPLGMSSNVHAPNCNRLALRGEQQEQDKVTKVAT